METPKNEKLGENCYTEKFAILQYLLVNELTVLFLAGGDICQCFGNATHGHWKGSSCEECVVGWAPTTCTTCAKGRFNV